MQRNSLKNSILLVLHACSRYILFPKESLSLSLSTNSDCARYLPCSRSPLAPFHVFIPRPLKRTIAHVHERVARVVACICSLARPLKRHRVLSPQNKWSSQSSKLPTLIPGGTQARERKPGRLHSTSTASRGLSSCSPTDLSRCSPFFQPYARSSLVDNYRRRFHTSLESSCVISGR